MIKGIIALFSSGLILAPQVLSGIILGFYFSIKMQMEQIKEIYRLPTFYAAVIFLVAVYVYFFKLTYKNDRGDIDWVDNIMRVFGYTMMFFIANICTIAFVFALFM